MNTIFTRLPDGDDVMLVRCMAQGDAAAFEALYERHNARLRAYLTRLLNDPALADEALQDAMFAAWRGAAAFRGQSKVSTWLYSIARSKAFKVRARYGATLPIDEEAFAVEAADPLESADASDQISAALRRLPAAQREAVELVFYHDLSGAEAAARLGIAPGTVKSRLSRAYATLRGLLMLTIVLAIVVALLINTVSPIPAVQVTTPTPVPATETPSADADFVSWDHQIQKLCNQLNTSSAVLFETVMSCYAPLLTDARKRDPVMIADLLIAMFFRRSELRLSKTASAAFSAEPQAWAAWAYQNAPGDPHNGVGYCFALLLREDNNLPDRVASIQMDNLTDAYTRSNFLVCQAIAQLKSQKDALAFASEAVRFDPANPLALVFKALALNVEKEYMEAEATFKQALEQHPALPYVYIYYARFLSSDVRKFDEAVRILDRVIALYPDNTSVPLYFKCVALMGSNDTTRAFKSCQDAQSLDPDGNNVALLTGRLQYQQRMYESAISSFETCRQTEHKLQTSGQITWIETYPECWVLPGLSKFLLGKCDEAVPLFNEARKFNVDAAMERLIQQGFEACAAKR